jgi:hypothetical protein
MSTLLEERKLEDGSSITGTANRTVTEKEYCDDLCNNDDTDETKWKGDKEPPLL